MYQPQGNIGDEGDGGNVFETCPGVLPRLNQSVHVGNQLRWDVSRIHRYVVTETKRVNWGRDVIVKKFKS